MPIAWPCSAVDATDDRDPIGADDRELHRVPRPGPTRPLPGACAQVYGGPAVATVDGTVGGESASARFRLTDACEIRRWPRNRALLGPSP
jgi:hypothetical protein